MKQKYIMRELYKMKRCFKIYDFQAWTPTLLQYKEDGHNLRLPWTCQPRPRCVTVYQRNGKFVQEDGGGGQNRYFYQTEQGVNKQ